MRIIHSILLTLCLATEVLAQCQISGTVKDPGGSPLKGGVVTFYNEATLTQAAVGVGAGGPAGVMGFYQSPVLPCPAQYTFRVDRGGAVSYVREHLQVSATATLDVVLYPTSWPLEPILALILTAIFFLSLILYRWNNIALLDQNQLWAEVAVTRARLLIDTGDPKSPLVEVLEDELADALRAFPRLTSSLKRAADTTTSDKRLRWILNRTPRWGNILFWTRGEEIAAWTRVREVQRLTIKLWPPHSTERLRAHLEMAEQNLRADASPARVAFAQLIQEALAVAEPYDEYEERWKQLLLESTRHINDAREETFTGVTIWQSKAAWLAFTACVFIVATVSARGGGLLFLAGAVGGFMSRLARALHSGDTPTDYGASWNTLFLSPLLGSLAGFFGVMLLQGLGSGGVLSDKFIGGGDSPLVLPSLAFLLGFSERLFNSLVDALDKQGTAQAKADAAAAQAAGTSPPKPPAAPATSVRDVQPMPAQPDGKVTVTGKGLDPNKVDGIELIAQDKSPVKIDNVVQEAEQIVFHLPKDLKDGSYILTIKVKDATFITKTVRVQQKAPDPKPVAPDPAPVAPAPAAPPAPAAAAPAPVAPPPATKPSSQH